MKTIINRFDLHRFERLVSKLAKPSELPATVSFSPCAEGLQFTAFCNDAVLTLTVPSDDVVASFTLPWATVKEFATKRNENIDLEVIGKNVTLSWSASGIPQTRTVQSLGLSDKRLPPLPDKTTAHSITLFDALVDAGRIINGEDKRYALGAICLRGVTNQIISTDGRQALMQDGYNWAFDDDVLCPVSRIFNSKELREVGDTVKVGVEGDWIFFNVSNVNFWLQKIEGRYPKFDQFTNDIGGHVWLHLDPTDVAFLVERLDALPGKDGKNDPVYVALNNGVAVRGHDTAKQTATELRLVKSRYEGGNAVVPMKRHQLKNGLDFGINRLGIDPNAESPLIGYGNEKMFIVMPLEGTEPQVDTAKITALASNARASVPSKTERSTKMDRLVPTTPTCRNVKPQVKSNAKPNGKAAVLDEAVKLRTNLRETLVSVNGLIQSIKSQRRQDKLLRDTMLSLRKLQNV